ncbi:MAG: S41 family peptidase, partial [Spirochaetaceae bacterium]|nr:S41 family peptidase [Spirochaetaceae bacterium]
LILFSLVFYSGCSLWPLDPVNSGESNFELLWKEYKLCYALFEEKGVDWDQVYRDYRPLVTSETSEVELFAIFKNILSLLNDTHIQLSSPFDFYKSGKGYLIENTFSLNNVKNNYLTSWKNDSSDYFTYGYLAPDVGYIHIRTMMSGETGIDTHEQWVEEINPILRGFSETRGLIVDVRNNGGGLIANSMYIASRFCDTKRVFSRSMTKNGPEPDDFSDVVENTIEPAAEIYSKPVILLTDNKTASAAEDFTMAMNSIASVTQVGAPTLGILSLSLKRELPNGWTYTVSVQKVLDINGGSPEGVGIYPEASNLIFNTLAEKNAGIDRQLEEAMGRL